MPVLWRSYLPMELCFSLQCLSVGIFHFLTHLFLFVVIDVHAVPHILRWFMHIVIFMRLYPERMIWFLIQILSFSDAKQSEAKVSSFLRSSDVIFLGYHER